MDLIFLYINKLRKKSYDLSLNLSNKCTCKYDSIQKKIKILSYNKELNIYGENIDSISVLVGRNGIGKTSILDLLGCAGSARKSLFPECNLSDNDNELADTWFAIYHLSDIDNKGYFIIEGCNYRAIEGISYYTTRPQYSVKIEYNFSSNEYKVISNLKDTPKNFFYLYYYRDDGIQWINDIRSHFSNIYKNGSQISRYIAPRCGYEIIMKYLYMSSRNVYNAKGRVNTLQRKMNTYVNGYVEISLIDIFNDGMDIEATKARNERLSNEVYGGKISILPSVQLPEKFLGNMTKKQVFLIKFLENFILSIIDKTSNNMLLPSYDDNKEFIYDERKNHLMNFIENRIEYTNDFTLLCKLVKIIEDFQEEIFKNNTGAYKTNNLYLGEMTNNYLQSFMCIIDEIISKSINIKINALIKVSFYGLSSGEIAYLDLYASLDNSIRKYLINTRRIRNRKCILLLDEPDARFHPEWSRSFINDLCEKLKSYPYNKINYQIIITTHSPYITADIPNKNIHRLDSDKAVRAIYSKNGLGSNLINLLCEDFFVRSVFGKFTECYINEILSFIKNIRYGAISAATYEDMLKRIEIIDDEIIKRTLKIRLSELKND